MKNYPFYLLAVFAVVHCPLAFPFFPFRLGGGGDSRGAGGFPPGGRVPEIPFQQLVLHADVFWLACHTVGAHYTFAEVPFEWFRELVGVHRNPFDRVAHFTVGFYAFPVAEYLVRKQYAGKVLAGIFGLFFVIEWQYAVIVGGNDANDLLGSQGDIFDSQKDMFCDTCGAVAS